MRRTSIALIAIICLAMCLSCAPTVQQQRYEAGELSEYTAEHAYMTLYRAFNAKQIDAGTMAEARRLYGDWQVAQRQYALAATMAGEGGDLAKAEERVSKAETALLRLAADAKVL